MYPGMVPIYTASRRSRPAPPVAFGPPTGNPTRTAYFLPPNANTAPYPVVNPVGLIPIGDFYMHLRSAAKLRKPIVGTAPNVFPLDVDYRPSMWLNDTERVALSAFIFGLETLRSVHVPDASREVWKFEPDYDTIATVLAELFSTIARFDDGPGTGVPSSEGIQSHNTSTFYAFLKPLALTSGISETLQKWYRLPTSINPKPVKGEVVTFGGQTDIPANNELLSDPKYGPPAFWSGAYKLRGGTPYNLSGAALDKWNGFHELLKEIFHALWVTLDSLRQPGDAPVPWQLKNLNDVQVADTPQVLQTRILAFMARLIGVYGMIPEKIREWLQRLSPYQDVVNEELLMLLDAYNLRIPQTTQQQQQQAIAPKPVPKEVNLDLPPGLRVAANEAKIIATPRSPGIATPTTPAAAAADSKYAASAAIAAVNDAKADLARASNLALRASIDSKTAAAFAGASTPGTPTAFAGPTASPIPAYAATTGGATGFGSNVNPIGGGGYLRAGNGYGKRAFPKRYQVKSSSASDDWGL